jgi:hypothetical protein
MADVVRVELANLPPRAPIPQEAMQGPVGTVMVPAVQTVIPGLERWRLRMHRQRAVTTSLRWLLVGLVVGVVLELVGLAVGAGSRTRALWLLGPALVSLAGAVAELRRRSPAVNEVARLLDHDLALAERVSTALELELRSDAYREDPGAEGLSGLVIAEGAAVVDRSLASARVAPKSARIERAMAAAGALGLAIALPLSGSGVGHPGGVVRAGVDSATRSAQVSNSRGPKTGGGAAALTRPSLPQADASRSSGSVHTRAGTASASHGAGRELAGRRFSGRPTTGPLSQELTAAGSRQATVRAGVGANQSRTGAAQGSSRSGPIGGQATRESSAAGALADHTLASRADRPASGARASHSGAPNAPDAPGVPGTPSRPSMSPALVARQAPPGSESAGAARASGVHGGPAAASKLGSAGLGLPIQPGYTASRDGQAKAGSGPTVTGGHGPARSSTVAAAGTASAALFPYIPPTPSLLPSLDDGLVLSYFGPFSWLLSATWQ